MYDGEWKQVLPTDTHILWTKAAANFACLCGNYVVVNDGPHTCKECGRVYRVQASVLVKEDRPCST